MAMAWHLSLVNQFKFSKKYMYIFNVSWPIVIKFHVQRERSHKVVLLIEVQTLVKTPTDLEWEKAFKYIYSKTCVKWPLKSRQNKGPNNNWYLNEGRKYYRMLPLEHSAILLTCMMNKHELVLKTIIWSF